MPGSSWRATTSVRSERKASAQMHRLEERTARSNASVTASNFLTVELDSWYRQDSDSSIMMQS